MYPRQNVAYKPVQIKADTKERLDNLKLVPMESYDNVINRLITEYSSKV